MTKKYNLKKIALWTFITTIIISALLGISALSGQYSQTNAKVLGSTATIGGFSLLIISSIVVYKKYPYVSYGGIISSLIGTFLFLNFIWSNSNDWDNQLKLVGDAITFSVLFAHSALILNIQPRKKFIKTAQNITIGLASLTALIIIMMINESIDFNIQFVGIIAIANVAMTILTPVLNRT